ncbi:ArsC/Spx/MgsR family protein [Euzebya pacifica]|uniref:ArsC/Spx/MgsR family protein n=1 Tax=Euzebya pacifica TaxID=1608957 RepID=UPI0030F504E6
MLDLAPRKLVRTADAKKLGLQMDGLDDDAVIALMAANPRIIERPVVISDDGRAVVGRPPERVNELLGP